MNAVYSCTPVQLYSVQLYTFIVHTRSHHLLSHSRVYKQKSEALRRTPSRPTRVETRVDIIYGVSQRNTAYATKFYGRLTDKRNPDPVVQGFRRTGRGGANVQDTH